MSLFRFFRRTPDRVLESPAAPVAPAPRPMSKPPPPSPPTPPSESSDSVEDAIEMFRAIQEVLGDGEDIIKLPSRVLLSGLPEDLRGPLWKADAFPDAAIELERKPLLQQLQKGRVVYPLNDLALGLPRGWVKSDPEAHVELNLAELVGALPTDLLQSSSQLDEEMIEVAQMKDFFGPPRAATPAAADAATPAPRPVAPSVTRPLVRREVRLTAPDGWDGVDRTADAGAAVVDINQADFAELSSVPGLRGARARLIIAFRQQFGPFRGIYELLAVPGIGRKVFRRATGLEPGLRRRGDRHAALNDLLGLPREERPALARIAQRAAETLGAAGFIIAGEDGIALAASEGVTDAERYAAIAPKLFRRTRRYLKQLSGSAVNAVHLPETAPPLLVLMMPCCHVVAALRPDAENSEALRKASRIAEEINWLLSRRAAVRSRA